jgi:hypothetical protein
VATTLTLFDARLIAGDRQRFHQLVLETTAQLRRDKRALRQRLQPIVQRRHAANPSATVSAAPDLVEGRGGLKDLQMLRWLQPKSDERTLAALDFELQLCEAMETLIGHTAHRLTPRLRERISRESDVLAELYRHARWVAFQLDGALIEPSANRSFGLSLAVRRGQLTAERLPPLERVPSMGFRVAHLIGFAPPSHALIDCYTPGGSGPNDFALDSHSFLALRQLHRWVESDDPFARRLWHTLRNRDLVYLAVLLHHTDAAAAIGRRAGLGEEAISTVQSLTQRYRALAEIATQRDLHDEDLLFDLAAQAPAHAVPGGSSPCDGRQWGSLE